MFMFRKKDVVVSTSTGLKKEAQKFQKVIAEINKTIKPENISVNVLNAFAEKNKLDLEIISDAFKTYLEKNALVAVRKVKATPNYTILDLETAVSEYGFGTDDLNITYFSQE